MSVIQYIFLIFMIFDDRTSWFLHSSKIPNDVMTEFWGSPLLLDRAGGLRRCEIGVVASVVWGVTDDSWGVSGDELGVYWSDKDVETQAQCWQELRRSDRLLLSSSPAVWELPCWVSSSALWNCPRKMFFC